MKIKAEKYKLFFEPEKPEEWYEIGKIVAVLESMKDAKYEVRYSYEQPKFLIISYKTIYKILTKLEFLM